MPGKSPNQRIEELNQRIDELEIAFKLDRSLANYKIEELLVHKAAHKATKADLQAKISDLTVKNATLEERCRNLEKHADRGWQLWLAALGFGFGLVSLLITVALQLKK